MGEIKSALELALERTAGIKSDKSGLKIKELENEGKRLAAKLVSGEISGEDFTKDMKKHDKESAKSVAGGCLSVFTSNLKLPSDEDFQEPLNKVSEGLQLIVKEKQHIKVMFDQISQFFSRYVETRKQIEEQLIAQYEPQLKRKEMEISRQTGTEIRLSPMQDPEFVQILKKQTSELDKQYNEALRQAKEQIKTLLY